MITIKLKFRPSIKHDNAGSLYFQIIKDSKVYRINTFHRIPSANWNKKTSQIIDSGDNRLLSIKADLEWRMGKLNEMVGNEENIESIIQSCHDRKEKSVFGYIQRQVERLRDLNRIRSSETMAASLRSFMRFRGTVDLSFERMDKDLMEQYEAWLKRSDVSRNTSSFYMRNLRSAYRMAVEDCITPDARPFRHVYTGVDKTVKRALSIGQLRVIRQLDLSRRPALELARDMLMFSFYARGMSFIDMAYLTKQNVAGGYISYRRRKTGQLLSIEYGKEISGIVDKYHSQTKYLLPLITSSGHERAQYCKWMTAINRNLKKVGEMANATIPLTMYVARHTWATIAHDKGFPLSVISGGLGHDNEQTTLIYLDSIQTSRIDEAHRSILSDL